MKIYAPKLTVTNTDEDAPEVARLNYGGQELPIKANQGKTLTVTNTDETAPEIARLNYGGEELPIKALTDSGFDLVECTISADDYAEIRALVFSSDDFTHKYTLKSVDLEKLGVKSKKGKIFWIKKEGETGREGLYFYAINNVTGTATQYYGTWGTAFFYNLTPDRRESPIACLFYQEVINGQLMNRLYCKYLGFKLPDIEVTNNYDGDKLSEIKFNGRTENIRLPRIGIENADENAGTIATLTIGDKDYLIKAETGGTSGGSGGILKSVTGNISADDWAKITDLSATAAAIYITIEDFSKPDLTTGELFRLSLTKNDDTSLYNRAVAVLTYNEYGVYTNKALLYFGGNTGAIYVVQGLISDTDHRLLIVRIK